MKNRFHLKGLLCLTKYVHEEIGSQSLTEALKYVQLAEKSARATRTSYGSSRPIFESTISRKTYDEEISVTNNEVLPLTQWLFLLWSGHSQHIT